MEIAKSPLLRGLFWSFGVFVLLFCLIFPGVRHVLKRDREAAAPRAGTAIVAVLRPPEPSATGEMSPAQALVRFRGGIHSVRAISGFENLRVGQPARVVYRVGRTGWLYVDSVAPLPAAEQGARQ